MDKAEIKKMEVLRKNMQQDLESCIKTAEQHKNADDGGAYAAQYKLAGDFLKQHIDYLDKEFPYLKETK